MKINNFDNDSNKYEGSEIEKFVNDWFNKFINQKKIKFREK